MDADDNFIDENMVWNVIHDFHKKEGLLCHQKESFNYFISNGVDNIIQETDVVVDQPELKYTAKFKNAYIPSPTIIDEDRKIKVLYPTEALKRDLNYDSTVYVDIDEIFEYENEKPEIISHRRIELAKVPIMLQSEKCNLTSLTEKEKLGKNECMHDNGGYFIIKGKERVLVGQIRGIYNQPVVVSQKAGDKYKYSCDVRSMSEETGHSVLLQCKIGIDDRTIVFSLPNIKDNIPVGIIFKALGFTEEKDILNIIGNNNKQVAKYLKYIIRDSYHITTQKEALKYIGQYSMHIIKDENREKYALQIVENELLPHMGITATIKEKAIYLGFVVNKLLNTHVGLRKEDDRDNYINKRVEMAGILCHDLFRTLFKRYVKNIQLQLEKKKQRPDILSVINRMTSITVGLKHSFATGNWGVQKNNYIRTGVSQVLARMNYGSTLSHLRRCVIPIGKEGKNAKIRQTHPSQIMYLCPNECFDPNTPILLWNGAIKMAKDINEGDYLIDDNGNPTRVRSTCSGFTTMYEVQQDKKNFMNYTVTDNHILTLKVRLFKQITKHNNRPKKYNIRWFNKQTLKDNYKDFSTLEEATEFSNTIKEDDILDITIEKYLKLSENIRKRLVGFKSNGINWEEKDIFLDPYILGMWLGDGNSDGSGFSTEDKELLEYWKVWCDNNNSKLNLISRKITERNKHIKYNYKEFQKSDKEKYRPDIQYNITSNTTKNSFKECLKKYNLINNKHIPLEYIINNRDIRLKVLAGLIDTDGNVRSNGHEIRISQGPANTKIIFDALFLAQSLGFSCHLNDGKSQWTHTFEDGNTEKRFSTYKELTITGEFLYEIPTLLARKKLISFSTNEISRKRCSSFLQSPIQVARKEFAPFVGWQLEGNGRFLLSDCTVVHNTPEGQSIGIVLNLALMTKVSLKIPTVVVKEIIEDCYYFTFIDDIELEENIYPKIFVNGILLGITKEPKNFINELKEYRKNNLLDKSISFTFDKEENEIKIFCDEGRLLRPVFSVNEEDNLLNIKKDTKVDWKMLVEDGYIKYIDNCEVENSVIAMDQTDLKKFKCNYCEIHPAMMMGVMSNAIPFPDHSQSPRNIYQCLDPNTSVLLIDGNRKAIKDIKIGDEVITFNPKTMELSNTKVIHQYVRPTENDIYKITTVSGREIIATGNHNFMTSEGWCPVDKMKINDSKIGIYAGMGSNITEFEYKNFNIFNNNAIFIPIKSIEKMQNQLISDITVESDNHSFIAGDNFLSSNSSMGKQAIGLYATSYQHRSDTITHVLNYVQRPLVSTLPSQFMGFNDMPMGMNVIVAIMTYGGFNQEDAVILNKGSVDRGLFHTTSYRTLMTEEKKQGSNNFETICIPPVDKRKKNANYSFLDENGVVKKRVNGKCVYVEKGDVIIGKTMTKSNKSSLEEDVCDVSYVIKSGEEGFIDRIFETITPNGYKMVKVVIRNNKIPEIGDKLASRAA
jgi:DNA-directed RNA polymerase beta subunit